MTVELTNKPGRLVGSTLFAFIDYFTMSSWVPKKTKLVLLLSTARQSDKIGEREKPEIVKF